MRVSSEADGNTNVTDEQLAGALNEVYTYAERESVRYGIIWAATNSARSFIGGHSHRHDTTCRLKRDVESGGAARAKGW
jgi:hypothetical protein